MLSILSKKRMYHVTKGQKHAFWPKNAIFSGQRIFPSGEWNFRSRESAADAGEWNFRSRESAVDAMEWNLRSRESAAPAMEWSFRSKERAGDASESALRSGQSQRRSHRSITSAQLHSANTVRYVFIIVVLNSNTIAKSPHAEGRFLPSRALELRKLFRYEGL
jgi:hypothetical protein